MKRRYGRKVSKKYKFEYKIVPIDLDQSLRTQEKILNDLGMRGWRAVCHLGKNRDAILMSRLLPKKQQNRIIVGEH